jgi:hypothetical protein
MEDYMLDYSIMKPEGILMLKPHTPLSKADFEGLSGIVDAYLSEHDKLHGILIQSRGFPGWANFGGFSAHMHFFHEHQKQIERVAIVTDSHFASMAESLGTNFIAAEVKHFPFDEDEQALDWLRSTSDLLS